MSDCVPNNKTYLQPRVVCGGLLLASLFVFTVGMTWGLPSRSVDRYLFGDEPVWSGKKILRLAGQREATRTRGADVDVNPLRERTQITRLNANDRQRAEIIRRYRLYTYQPDEMVTMMALASMSPGQGDLDPKLYQYGGLWVYPIGALLKVASLLGAITLTTDLTYYLDHPDAFGRFYVVARLYVVAWALVGVWVVFRMACRLTGGCLAAMAAASTCYIAMPVVVNMAHEAKPHLPGAVLVLATVLAAMRYVETGKRVWWAIMVVLCGAALGMVLAAWPAFAVLLIAERMRKQKWGVCFRWAALGGVIGVATYGVTNPYVVINLFGNRALLWSNLGNTSAMFNPSLTIGGLTNAARLIGEGGSFAAVVVGTIASLVLIARSVFFRLGRPVRYSEGENERAWRLGGLLAVPALLNLAQFVVYADGQPGEYGRFAVLPDIGLVIAAVVGIRMWLHRRAVRFGALLLLVILTAQPGFSYLGGFMRDRGDETRRLWAGRRLESLRMEGACSLGLVAEPAPYSLPPVDLFRWQLFLLPTDRATMPAIAPTDVVVAPDVWQTRLGRWMELYEKRWDDGTTAVAGKVWHGLVINAISWADRRFDIAVCKQTQTVFPGGTSRDAP